MTDESARWNFINNLDDELLKGGVILSEWSTFLVRDADLAFASGANLAAIFTAMAGIETHLKYEYGKSTRQRLVDLIDTAAIETDLRDDLHRLRRYRNEWVHVGDPADDEEMLTSPERFDGKLEEMAILAITSLRRTIYTEQWL